MKDKQALAMFPSTPTEMYEEKGRKLDEFYETQTTSQDQMDIEDKTKLPNTLKRILIEGGTK